MNKAQLIARVQRNMGMGSTRESARAAVEAVLSSIATASQHERIELRGFGTFHHKYKAEHKVKHPASKEDIIIPAHSDLSFIPSSHPDHPKLRAVLKKPI